MQLSSQTNTIALEDDFTAIDLFITNILRIVFAAVLVMGIKGNLLNIIVFSQSKLRKSLVFQLILCLSFIDLGVLGILFLLMLNFH